MKKVRSVGLLLVFILLFEICTAMSAGAQEPVADAEFPVEVTGPIPGEVVPSTVSLWVKHLLDAISDPSVTEKTAGFVVAVFGGIIAFVKVKASEYKRRLTGPRFSLPEKFEESMNRVLLVGIGGVGKTSLIKKITAHSEIDPRIRSADFRTYSLVHEVSSTRSQKVCRIDIDDYRGQDLGQLVDAWSTRKNGLKNANIESIVMVVDLFKPVGAGGAALRSSPNIDLDRVNHNISEWSNAAISAIMSLPSNRPRYICLFINKCDALVPWTEESEDKIVSLYQPLADALGSRSSGGLFRVIVGSAVSDRGTMRLLHELIEQSAPIR